MALGGAPGRRWAARVLVRRGSARPVAVARTDERRIPATAARRAPHPARATRALLIAAALVTGCPRRADPPLDAAAVCAALTAGTMEAPVTGCASVVALAPAAGCVAERDRLVLCVERECRAAPPVEGASRGPPESCRLADWCQPQLEALRACVAPCQRRDVVHAGAERADGGPSFSARGRGCGEGCTPAPGTAPGGACTSATVCAEVCCRCPEGPASFTARACDGARCLGGTEPCERVLAARGRDMLCR